MPIITTLSIRVFLLSLSLALAWSADSPAAAADPVTLTPVGSFIYDGKETVSAAKDIAVVGDYAYTTRQRKKRDGVDILDISDPTNPTLVGTISDNDTRALDGAWGIAVVGDYAYVTSVIEGGLTVLDISDPTAPTQVGAMSKETAPALAGAKGLAVVGDYAYVVSEDGVAVVRLRVPSPECRIGCGGAVSSNRLSPLNLTLVRHIADDATTALSGSQAIAVVGDYAYVAS